MSSRFEWGVNASMGHVMFYMGRRVVICSCFIEGLVSVVCRVCLLAFRHSSQMERMPLIFSALYLKTKLLDEIE